MVENMILITNNPLVLKDLKDNSKINKINFVDGTIMDVYKEVRNLVHKGYKVLTHPLMSSVKPNETPYRTVAISVEKSDSMDMQSLMVIEGAIATTDKFLKNGKTPKWTEKILNDFQIIDFDLIYHVLN